jgi:hypothetical protein
MESAGPMQGAIRAVGHDAVYDALRNAVAPFTDPNGAIQFENTFAWVIGEKP